ncbi:unnamed protein product [Rotaria sp. Silwood1]|nr:unnamed protein product [Rotaria sp. Silwood1]CAF3814445.1 unnamed protein product [Rotaria sp. Silwood1]CAF3876762.1 unnamed protein product [Rotaria sp. Silwood1]CAF4786223.1 unnamed protein product [Rotaria sp. Silwood1]CAF4989196.1 unnamed protein product [Rotaria sp. Silwood1]
MGASSGTTVAGQANGVRGTNSSHLYGPTFICLDSSYNLYVADSDNHRIQFWSNGASSGTTVAGTAMSMFTGFSGSANNLLNRPYGVVRDPNSGTIYIADYSNHRVVSYVTGASSGTIVAGGNGPGTNNTQLRNPAGLYFDSSTNSLVIANYGAHNIVRWVLGANSWTLIVGSINGSAGNTSTLLNYPTDVTFDSMGNMYVVDMFNHRVQFFFEGQMNGTTIAGVTGEIGNNATLLNFPVSIVLDTELNLYVADMYNHRIQKFPSYLLRSLLI